MQYRLPRGMVRICAGLVEAQQTLPEAYRQAIAQAESRVGTSFSIDAEGTRLMLAEAIKLNLISRKEYPFETLQARYRLPISLSTFRREKFRFCYHLAAALGMVDKM